MSTCTDAGAGVILSTIDTVPTTTNFNTATDADLNAAADIDADL